MMIITMAKMMTLLMVLTIRVSSTRVDAFLFTSMLRMAQVDCVTARECFLRNTSFPAGIRNIYNIRSRAVTKST